VDKFHLS